MDTEQLLTVKEAAVMLRVGRSTVYDLMRTRELPSLNIGRGRRIELQELRAYIKRRARADTDPKTWAKKAAG